MVSVNRCRPTGKTGWHHELLSRLFASSVCLRTGLTASVVVANNDCSLWGVLPMSIYCFMRYAGAWILCSRIFSVAQLSPPFDLLILAMYADGHLTTFADRQLQKLLAAMGCTKTPDRQREFDTTVTRMHRRWNRATRPRNRRALGWCFLHSRPAAAGLLGGGTNHGQRQSRERLGKHAADETTHEISAVNNPPHRHCHPHPQLQMRG